MERCDVLIVGGGPSGSTCAWALHRLGFDVIVMDKAGFPRDKVCAGWITPAVIEALEIELDDYAGAHVLQPITGFHTGMTGTSGITTTYERTVSYGIRRREFDDFLLRRSGARLRLAEPLRSLRKVGGAWIANESIHAALVVGAAGHFCPVARMLGARVGSGERTVAASEIEFRLDASQWSYCRVDGAVPQLFFCRDLKGYGWCFRKGDYLNVGLGREDTHRLSQHLRQFCDFLLERNLIPNIHDRFNGHAYLLYQHGNRSLVDSGVLLIGDAAGLAYTESGEGIRPAVESALIAANLINAWQGDYRSSNMAVYMERLEAHFGRRRKDEARHTPQVVRQLVAARFLANRWFTRHVVLDRWFLHADQATLA